MSSSKIAMCSTLVGFSEMINMAILLNTGRLKINGNKMLTRDKLLFIHSAAFFHQKYFLIVCLIQVRRLISSYRACTWKMSNSFLATRTSFEPTGLSFKSFNFALKFYFSSELTGLTKSASSRIR